MHDDLDDLDDDPKVTEGQVVDRQLSDDHSDDGLAFWAVAKVPPALGVELLSRVLHQNEIRIAKQDHCLLSKCVFAIANASPQYLTLFFRLPVELRSPQKNFVSGLPFCVSHFACSRSLLRGDQGLPLLLKLPDCYSKRLRIIHVLKSNCFLVLATDAAVPHGAKQYYRQVHCFQLHRLVRLPVPFLPLLATPRHIGAKFQTHMFF